MNVQVVLTKRLFVVRMEMMKLLTIKETAVALRVSCSTVYALVEQRQLQCHRVGSGRGSIRIDENDLKQYLESCRLGPPPAKRKRPKHVEKLNHLRLNNSSNS